MGLFAVSQYGKFKKYIRPAVEEIRDDRGRLVRAYKRPLRVEFQQGGGIPDYARAEARARLAFLGASEDEDPMMRMGWFDLDLAAQQNGWDDEEKEIIEESIRAAEGTDYIIVRPVQASAPYPQYDQHRRVQGRRTVEHAIKDISAAYELAGFDVGQAIAYEQQHGNDPEVVAALGALGVAPEEDEAEPLIAA